MLMRCSLWMQFGLFWWYLRVLPVKGFIGLTIELGTHLDLTSFVAGVNNQEIVELQGCLDQEYRLTCRELDSHIAILEAWYTPLKELRRYEATKKNLKNYSRVTTKRPKRSWTEFQQVFAYSSPKHDGLYEPTNRTSYENVTQKLDPEPDIAKNASDEEISNFFKGMLSQSQEMADIDEINKNSAVNSLGSDERSNQVLDAFRVTDAMGNLNSTEPTKVVNVTKTNKRDCVVPQFQNSFVSFRAEERKRGLMMFIQNASINLRAPLSYRCAGVNHCSFVATQDWPAPAAAAARRVDFPPGALYIKFACFDDTESVHFCNREVAVSASGEGSEGYVRTPGYPHYYVGGARCRWRLTASPHQRLRLTLLDLNLRSIGPLESGCADYLRISARGQELYRACGHSATPATLLAPPAVEVLVHASSSGAEPKRGVLLHYKSIGCVTLSPPSNGYFVYRNESVAVYMCHVGYTFADTQQRARVLKCVDDNRWHEILPFCVYERSVIGGQVANDSLPRNKDPAKLPSNENMIVDIVIPSLLIVALFIGNALIVLIIYKYRKRKNEECEDELNTIPLSSNGNLHLTGNAV